MGFDLSEYEDVATLNQWFQDNYPMGRLGIIEWKHNEEKNEIHFIVGAWRDANDQHPAVMNYARGKQEEYNRNMARFYGEDVITSAYGRAILLLKGANKTAHKEGIERAKNSFEDRAKNIVKEKIEIEKPSDPWTIETKEMPLPVEQALNQLNDGIKPLEIPMCPKHNKPMQSKSGNKNGKPWFHYKCIGDWPNTCNEIIWYEIDKSGQWRPQKPRMQQGALN